MFLLVLLAIVLAMPLVADAADADQPLRIGIIGLDTSHSIAFTKALNAERPKPGLEGCRVVAAYPQGSADIESSVSRVPGYTAEIQKYGVEIVDSIELLLTKVDAVLLESNDGRPHRDQVLPVLKAGKPVFVDKPLAGSLTDCVAIFELARRYRVPLFSASSLRYGKDTQKVRAGEIGALQSAEASSPASLEKTHPDLFWYGIHGVEALFTALGPECLEIARDSVDGKIRVTGRWSGGRTGTFLEGKGYSGTATGVAGKHSIGSYDGYDPLLVEIVKFFRTGQPPVSEAETLAIYTFMEAADESKRQNGATVQLAPVLEKARKAALHSLPPAE